MLREFRDFLLKGNLIALAVAFVIGAAIVALVNALVGDLIMPVVAAIVGKTDFSSLTFTIHKSVFKYGDFISALIAFVSIAAAVFFFVVKPVDAVKARFAKPGEEELSDEERRHREILSALQGLK
jgi:large conductance mechanosensitive channel protein